MSDETSEEKIKPERALSKRTSAKSTVATADGSSGAPRKRASRTRAIRKPTEKKVVAKIPKKEELPDNIIEKKETPAIARKAPTPISAELKEKRAAKKRFIIASLIILVGVGGSAGIGYTDKGGIDVNQTIDARNEKIRQSGSNELILPVQNTSQEPDGGLIGRGIGTPKATTTKETETDTTTEAVEGSAETSAEGQVPLSSREAISSPVATSSADN